MRGKKKIHRLKEQKEQILEGKVGMERRQGRDYSFTFPLSLSMICVGCYFLPSTELNSREKLVSNTYWLPLSQMKETDNQQETNLNFVMKHMDIIYWESKART